MILYCLGRWSQIVAQNHFLNPSIRLRNLVRITFVWCGRQFRCLRGLGETGRRGRRNMREPKQARYQLLWRNQLLGPPPGLADFANYLCDSQLLPQGLTARGKTFCVDRVG